MKPIHWNKVFAISSAKAKAFFGKNCIIMPIFAIGFTALMRILYGQVIGDDIGIDGFSNAYALGMGLIMNTSMTGIYCPALLLAEEKEKKTLRVLMTSSVNGLEFFLGSIIPIFLAAVILNLLLIPVSGYIMPLSAVPIFAVVNILCVLISCIIGMLLGIFAKNQVSAGTLLTPVMLVFMLVPMLSAIIEIFGRISDFVFTGIMMNLVMNSVTKAGSLVSPAGIAVMVAEAVLAILLFLVCYKRNGFEKD